MTDNFFFPNKREVFALTTQGQLYSVTNGAWYGVIPGTLGRTTGKLYWNTNSIYGNKTFSGTPTNDGTGRTRLFMKNALGTITYSFCIANKASGDGNSNTGYHVYFYTTTAQTNCPLTYLYLSPVGNG